MKFLYLIFFLFYFSCAYPDIDSVPDFKNLIISKQEALDLCDLSYKNLKKSNQCKENYFYLEKEKKAIKFCKLIESNKLFVKISNKDSYNKCIDNYLNQLDSDFDPISLCKSNNTDKDSFNKCINKYYIKEIK